MLISVFFFFFLLSLFKFNIDSFVAVYVILIRENLKCLKGDERDEVLKAV